MANKNMKKMLNIVIRKMQVKNHTFCDATANLLRDS